MPRIFLGYALYARESGKETDWCTDLEELRAPEIHVRRLDAREEITPKNGEHFIFPVAEERVKLFRGGQVLRTCSFTTGTS